MSCNLELFGYIDDWQGIKNFLDSDDQREQGTDESDWKNDWDWEDDNDNGNNSKSAPAITKNKNWLQSCIVAHSPTSDVLIFGKQSKSTFLSGIWDDKRNQMKYIKSFQGVLCQSGEQITSFACIPLISKKASSPGTPDWTCAVVGFSTGFVRMYTEEGLFLFEQQFHNENVKSFKIRAYQAASSSFEHDQLEELIVLYEKAIITIDGFNLFQTLRACRSQLARLQASASRNAQLQSPPLAFKKWEFEGIDDSIADCDLTALKTPSIFDHLYNGSLLGGVGSKCSPSPGSSYEYVTTGKHPFVSFQYAQETQRAPVLTDIAFAVANSLINVGRDWWRSKSSTPQKEPHPPPEEKTAAAQMFCRFGFRDAERFGTRLAISPCHKFCTVTDSLGRIILLDLVRGLAVRIWKGYRDAECSWLEVQEEKSSKSVQYGIRRATFLIIYARARSVLEVFPMQQGSKLATFNVSRTGILLSTTHGLLGVNDGSSHTSAHTHQMLQSMFIEEDGNIYNFVIPFHFALEKANSKLKDAHLLKSLQQLIRRGEFSTSTVLDILTKISGQTMVNQAFRYLTQKCKFEELQQVLREFINSIEQSASGMTLVLPSQLLTLIELYEVLHKSWKKAENLSPSEDLESDDSSAAIQMTEKEMKSLVSMWSKNCINTTSKHKPTVRFEKTEDVLSSPDFFSCFNVEFDPSKPVQKDLSLTPPSFSNEAFASFLLRGCFSGTLDVFKWQEAVRSSKLDISALLKVTLNYWVTNALSFPHYHGAMRILFEVLKAHCELAGSEAIGTRFNEINAWWEGIRQEISTHAELFQIYSFSLVCRAVAIDLVLEIEAKADAIKDAAENIESAKTESDSYEWESMPLDLLKWNVLLKQIEDLSILAAVIMSDEDVGSSVLPVLYQTVGPLSATHLLEKGRGCIAETVGKWLTTLGVDPALIAILDDDEIHEGGKAEQEKRSSESESESKDGTQAIGTDTTRMLRTLLDNFQVSLSSPSAILANYCWEYCVEWNKSPNRIELLSAAFSCMECMSSQLIKQGMMCLMWNTILMKKVCKEVAAENVSGSELWADKRSDFASGESRLEFFKICVDFLGSLMDTHRRCGPLSAEATDQREVKNHWTQAASSASLVDLALSQPRPNYDMIRLHYQLVLSADLMQVFQIRKPLLTPTNMFDTRSRSVLFQNISNEIAAPSVEVDLALKNLREEFLCLVISGAISSIPEEPCSVSVAKAIPLTDGIKDCDKWIEKCFELGRIWGLDLDVLRVNQICEYYSNGFDFLGEQIIAAVRAKDVLGAKLLVIAGMRVSYLMNQSSACVPEMLSSVSTNLSNWLDNLDYSVLKRLRCSKECILALAQQVVQLIPESSYDFKLAEELLLSSSFL